MDPAMLKKLTRAELQKLAKKMGIKANRTNAYMIQRLCNVVQSNPGAKPDAHTSSTSMEAPSTSHRRTSQRKRSASVDLIQKRASDAETEPIERDVYAPPAAGPSKHVATATLSSQSKAAMQVSVRRAGDSEASSSRISRAHATTALVSPTQGSLNHTHASAKPTAWTPIIVGEREGEPGYHQPIFMGAVEDAGHSQLRHGSLRATARYPNFSSINSPACPPSISRPQVVPRMHEEIRSDYSESPVAPEYLHPSQLESPSEAENAQIKDPGTPTLDELEQTLADLEEQSQVVAEVQHEVERLRRVIGMIRNKELWMDVKLREVQQLRLAVEQHYIARVKTKPWLLGDDVGTESDEDGFFGATEQRLGEDMESIKCADAPRYDNSPSHPNAPIHRDFADFRRVSKDRRKRRADDIDLPGNGEGSPKRLRIAER